MRIGLTVALILAVIGEMLTSENGLGWYVLLAARAFRSADLFAGVIVLGLIGLVSNLALAGDRALCAALEAALAAISSITTWPVRFVRCVMGKADTARDETIRRSADLQRLPFSRSGSAHALGRAGDRALRPRRHGQRRAGFAHVRARARVMFLRGQLASDALARLEAQAQPSLRPVFNLTGTVLHTNLGRALIAQAAIDAAVAAMHSAVALEFDIASGRRGERDDHLRELLCELTGAEDATVVNNNAAAVLLTLNTLAKGREVIVSRGELIEIGGAFRLPEIMGRAGAKLVEVGTTNRTHARDYEQRDRRQDRAGAQGSHLELPGRGIYRRGECARARERLPRARNVPLMHDLGSGTLVDLARFGLAHEPTVAEAIADGADLVTFSGDKLLGGPQAGFIVGRKDLLARINKNPMKRALRVDKMRLAALEATLKLYRDPDRLAEQPSDHSSAGALARCSSRAAAHRLPSSRPDASAPQFVVERSTARARSARALCRSRQYRARGLRSGRALRAVPDTHSPRSRPRFRALPIPVIGRIENDALVFDLRCLEDEAQFISNLARLQAKS